MNRPNKNVARGEATRGQLIAIATRLFAERGYEDTSIEAVLREAGGRRGSPYHPFPGKDAPVQAGAQELQTSGGGQTPTPPPRAHRAGAAARPPAPPPRQPRG